MLRYCKITLQVFLFENVLFSVIQSSQYFLKHTEVQQKHRPLWRELQNRIPNDQMILSCKHNKGEQATDAQGKIVFKFQAVKLHSTQRVIYL